MLLSNRIYFISQQVNSYQTGIIFFLKHQHRFYILTHKHTHTAPRPE